MERSNRLCFVLLTSVAALCAQACAEIPEPGEETSAESAALAATINLTVTNVPVWPRKIEFTGDHEEHLPYIWETSWAGAGSMRAISITLNSEACGVWARVSQDTVPAGQLPHSSGTATANAIDVRSSFSAPPSSQSVPANTFAYLSVPSPHAGHHCDGLGTFSWEILNQSTGAWSPVAGSQNLNPAAVSSSPGSETYRIRCSHPQGVHYGTPMTVTWTAVPAPPTCAVACNETAYPQFQCNISASGGTGSYSYFSNYNNQGWQSVSNPSTWICKYRIAGYRYSVDFKARDSAGQECAPRTWNCGLIDLE